MALYKKLSLSELPAQLVSSPYVLICSSSFEERCLSIPGRIDPGAVTHALVCENEDLREVVGTNTGKLIERFGGKSVHVPLRTDNPVYGADNLQKSLAMGTSGGPRNYLIDITTFTHEGLLILLSLLRRNANPADTALFAYNPAKDYAVGIPQKDKWLSKGIGEIRSVLGYPGSLWPSRRSHLIVLVGYEVDRAGMLIDAYEPSAVSLGLGGEKESVSEDLYKLNIVFHQRLKEKLNNVNEFTFSCVNAYSTKEAIERQIRAFAGYNTVLAPMNTKISSVGAALAAFANESIQLCYAQAEHYNYDKYSSPGEECVLFDVPDLFAK